MSLQFVVLAKKAKCGADIWQEKNNGRSDHDKISLSVPSVTKIISMNNPRHINSHLRTGMYKRNPYICTKHALLEHMHTHTYKHKHTHTHTHTQTHRVSHKLSLSVSV